MLEINNLVVGYGAIKALHGVTFMVPVGAIVTLIGAIGAGKTTTLRAISGLIPSQGGTVVYDGQDITNQAAHRIVARGLCHVPEGRMVFANLSVEENLQMGAYLRKDRPGIAADMEYSFHLFPRLKERMHQQAGTMSGGEQQMLAIARALMSKPRCLMLDEPSLGIAPMLTRSIFEQIVAINRERKLTILLVEQNANLALKVSSYGYVLETGSVLLEDSAAALRANPEVRAAYLGD
jgi:branched-chain amino acid transport system ATP-binding protein